MNDQVVQLAARYHAVIDWQRQLKRSTFTIDVQPIFVRADQRPVFFYGTLEDVKRQDNSLLLYFSTTPTEREPVLQVILDCGSCDVEGLKASANEIGDFGVIAQVTTATKSLDESEDAPAYLLHGRFIDARFVGDYAVDRALGTH